MPGPKSGVHGLLCENREGTACTKVVLQSECSLGSRMAVVFAVFFPGAPAVSCFGLLAVLRLLLIGLFRGFLFGSLVFWVLLVAGRLCRPRLVASRGGRRVCPVWLAVLGPRSGGARPPGSLGLQSLLALFSGSPWTSSIFSQFLYLGRFAAFFVLRSTRQVERFSVCSSGICRL